MGERDLHQQVHAWRGSLHGDAERDLDALELVAMGQLTGALMSSEFGATID
jgi:hypothetical protein